ncbi:ABC transporter ATP-binding protein [Ideonella sp. B7]|uniref:ABC transporter ATP-binding protein n=1 Tax=Ideonella benzenivorans TaxID=2831643 RepID=UPI001CED12AC|nr:ABC transporter ATP-binding protein [Ideonella benzenivorans]MCA6215266.1 ABC transporter ATP-binding protein [Ideonella benzenivorans]
MLELVNLTKYYPTPLGRHYVFRNLNFHFPEDASIGLMGRNGAGKSTLMRIIAGVEVPDQGHVRTDKTMSWRVGLGGGFQGTLSSRDNVRFVCRLFSASPEETRAKVRYVEEFAEIGKFFDMPMKSLSSGMRGRVTFGLSLAFEFDYYLIDEGMAAGDPIFRKKAQAAFEQHVSKGKLILVSHNPKDIQNLCDVVVILENGQATLYNDVKEGLEIYQNMQRPTKIEGP